MIWALCLKEPHSASNFIKCSRAMVKGKCPNCNKELSTKLYARHTRWSPIECPNCYRRYHFDKREWLLQHVPILLSVFASIVNTYWGRIVFSREEHLVISSGCLLAVIIFGIHFLINIKNIKLVETK